MNDADPDAHDAVQKQRAYYARTASAYDDLHGHEDGAHEIALGYIAGLVPGLGARRVLDVGAGTGRGVERLRALLPGVEVVGVEPVPELVAEGHRKGLTPESLRVGDGAALPFGDGDFDVVIATGVMHHVPRPALVLAEMMRVARRAVFVSDSNRFGQGRLPARVAKLGLWSAGLWKGVRHRAHARQGLHGVGWRRRLLLVAASSTTCRGSRPGAGAR
ncbi:MAG: class I SAM-dependent methyltransferase [Myxococcota bacterium]